eukprot:1175344-Prorocentrum_minimum.AAC.5
MRVCTVLVLALIGTYGLLSAAKPTNTWLRNACHYLRPMFCRLRGQRANSKSSQIISAVQDVPPPSDWKTRKAERREDARKKGKPTGFEIKHKWLGGAIGKDGVLYAIPSHFDAVLKIDSSTGKVTLSPARLPLQCLSPTQIL